jgi:hypothetical protein
VVMLASLEVFLTASRAHSLARDLGLYLVRHLPNPRQVARGDEGVLAGVHW